jgi:putative endonuclease
VGGDRRRLATAGEELAAEWYRAAGYTVLDRNWRCDLGEIDLVCRHGPTVVVVEVETGRATRARSPAEAITLVKQARLRRLARRWLAQHAVGCREVR